MSARTCLTIVLAAGEGTRMRASRPKVLHAIGGHSLIAHVLAAAGTVGGAQAVVVGPAQEAVVAAVKAAMPGTELFVQGERRGTAHAALAAKPALVRGADDVLIVFADTPLITPHTLARLRSALVQGAAVAVLGFRPADPTGYGRLIVGADGRLMAIREEKDATAQECAISLCNAGLMALRGEAALAILERIGDDNAKREFYLTDAVAVARGLGLPAMALETEEDEVRGVNTQAQLAEAEAVHDAGVAMAAPETVHLSADTRLGRDVVIEPYVVFGPGVTVEDGAVIRSFSHLEGATVGRGARVGPFARLRPGARLEADVHVGNFVEVKEARLAAGAKANHLAYIGDASVGEGSNIGAGAITCNYDGAAKHRTEIGKAVFIGSNAAMVAPVRIGDGAYVGTGSVITSDVPADALALGRSRQVNKEGWARRLRSLIGAGRKAP
jgi:bifunctional UDP-N-acetylglucosamine pyrophosphorylase/glucosamine-1-phosphate N-acetyltransferase